MMCKINYDDDDVHCQAIPWNDQNASPTNQKTAGSNRDVDKSRVVGNLPGCESTFTRLINWGNKLKYYSFFW